jgi:hypothetical protein
MLNMLRAAVALAPLLLSNAYYVQTIFASPRKAACSPARALRNLLVMQIDYTDPVVEEKYNEVKAMTRPQIEEALGQKGLPKNLFPEDDTMLQLMFVEVDLRSQGIIDDKGKVIANDGKKAKPKTYSGKFEETYYENRFFREWIDESEKERKGNNIVFNLAQDYLDNTPEIFEERYQDEPMREYVVNTVKELLVKKEEITTPKFKWSGFPYAMGEMGCKAAFSETGEVVSITFDMSANGVSGEGTVEWKELDSAKAFYDKYNGVDMGFGTAIELDPMQ